MRARLSTLAIVLSILAALLPWGAFSAAAQDARPPAPDRQVPFQVPPDGRLGAPGVKELGDTWAAPEGYRAAGIPARTAPAASGGPDAYGYTWNDTVPFNWIDATLGTDSGLAGDDEYTGPIDIGFAFKFYENSYTQLYVGSNGLVTFGAGTSLWSNVGIPNAPVPNNYVAPFWDDLCVDCAGFNTGKVYTMLGGSAPNRYFVIEWHEISKLSTNSLLTFEAVLYENGDIVFQYLSLAGYLESATVGIEDDVGVDGLQYLYDQPGLGDNLAVRFYRPPTPAARVKFWPLQQSRFARAGQTIAFELPLRNSGDLGTDTYDLTVTSIWPVGLYAADGYTPLVDSDGDAIVDTGPLAQGGTLLVVAQVAAPGVLNVGNHNSATLDVCSSRDPAVCRAVTLRSAIPAPFAQVYRDRADEAVSLLLVRPDSQAVRKVSYDGSAPPEVAVIETGSGLLTAWSEGRNTGQAWVAEVWLAMTDREGEPVAPAVRLADHSGAELDTYDRSPALAVAPDGHIGVLCYRTLRDSSTAKYNLNIYFAVLDAAGNLAYGPANLTGNTIWEQWGSYDWPRFQDPTIVATADNRFVLAWQRTERRSPGGGCSDLCDVDDIYFAVRSTSGAVVRPVAPFTSDTPGADEGYHDPNLASLRASRVLLSWQRDSQQDIYYTVLDSSGNAVTAVANLVGDGSSTSDWRPDAVQLTYGRILVAWTGSGLPQNRIRYAVLDQAYNRIAGPTFLEAPEALQGSGFVSVAADAGDHAILTWMEPGVYQPNLYYALVGSSGTLLTPPMVFASSRDQRPYIDTSFTGFGNTSLTFAGPGGLRVYLPLVMSQH
jgi:hypothetical protein